MLRSMDLTTNQTSVEQLVSCTPPRVHYSPSTPLQKCRQGIRGVHARLVNNQPRPRLQRSNLVPQDPDTVLIWPVMKYCAEEIDIRPLHRLFVEEVIRHETCPAAELWRHMCWPFCHHIREVLDNEVQVWEALRESDAYGAVAAADVYNRSVGEGRPVETVGKGVQGYFRSKCCHCACPSAASLGILP